VHQSPNWPGAIAIDFSLAYHFQTINTGLTSISTVAANLKLATMWSLTQGWGWAAKVANDMQCALISYIVTWILERLQI
jgi:hypothetical protein